MRNVMAFILVSLVSLSAYSAVDVRGLNQGLTNTNALKVMHERERFFTQRGTTNPGRSNMFPRDNRGETHQNRIALNNWRKRGFLVFDIDVNANKQVDVLDWSKVNSLKQISSALTTLTIDTTNMEDKNSPVVMVFLSNQQHTNDFLSTESYEELRRLGVTLVVFEYPGTGASLGLPDLKAWHVAGVGAINILSKRLQKKVFLVGHSLGGGTVFDLPRDPEAVKKIAGVVSYGGIFSTHEASKTQVDWGVEWMNNFINPIIAKLMAPGSYDSTEGMLMMAKNQVPALVMHGTNDPSVSFKHLKVFEVEMNKLKKTYTRANFQTVVYENYQHEEIFSNGLPEFYQVWSDIVSFINEASASARKKTKIY